MVTRNMPARLLRLFLVCMVLCLPFSAVSSELHVSVDKQEIELGKSFRLYLHSSQTRVSLNTIDIKQLLKNFHIKDFGESVIDNSHQARKITLYPRFTGQLLIPGFHFLGTTSKPVPVNITSAIDPKDGSRIDVNYTISTLTPWKKQQVHVRLDVTSHSSVLVLHTPEGFSDENEIITLDSFSIPANNINSKLTVHSAGWVIFPRQAGKQTLSLPAIGLVRDGVTTHRFYPPHLQLDVKPLPVYVPATMPIGKLELTGDPKPVKVLFKNETYSTTFKLRGYGIMPSGLPSLATQLKSNETISYYPVTRNITHTATGYGLVSDDNYRVNFKTNQQGLNHPGLLQLNYFDPDTGTIKTVSHKMGTRFVVGNSLLILVVLVLGFSGYYLIVISYKWLSSRWRCLSGYYHVMQSLPAVKQPVDIKQGLMNIARAENWLHNMTLQQWHHQWSINIKKPCPLDISKLEKALYKDKKPDIQQLKQEMGKLCTNRWPVLKILNKKGV